jgi:RNA polymerase sigma factor (sigma-70 family)
LLTSLVFTIVKPSMTESIRSPGREAQHVPSIRSGIEGYADGMRIFPRLKEWENQIALQALREGKTVNDLRSITPFRQYLGVDQRAHMAGESSPFSSFTSLFAASPSIDMLVSLGNFHPIRTWTWTLAQTYPNLNLPLEQFFQDALYTIIPHQARVYDPSYGSSFNTFVVEMLKKHFINFVHKHKREHSSPARYEDKPPSKKGKAAASKERVMFASLDAPMPHSDTPQTFFEYLETTHHTPQDTTHAEDQEARDKIHLLAQLAGLNHNQEETLIALYIYGGNTKLISQMRRCTTRNVRTLRQTALESIQGLGYETVKGILTGSTTPQRR